MSVVDDDCIMAKRILITTRNEEVRLGFGEFAGRAILQLRGEENSARWIPPVRVGFVDVTAFCEHCICCLGAVYGRNQIRRECKLISLEGYRQRSGFTERQSPGQVISTIEDP